MGTEVLSMRDTDTDMRYFKHLSDYSKQLSLLQFNLKPPNVLFQVNPAMVPRFESSGLTFPGKDETGQRMEIVELPNHPFYVGAQFHPEYKSRPGKPSPLFLGKKKKQTQNLVTLSLCNAYLLTKPYCAGLIGAASGELDNVLQQSCQESVVSRPHSNGKLERLYWKGAAKKPVSVVYSVCDRVCS